ncbi:thioredoxin-disulfide reductase [Chloroflexota bacterium]
MSEEYDVIIIGGGPAGLTAGIYTSRNRLSSLLLEKGLAGGQITEAELVENYPGFAEGISGIELGQMMHQQAMKHGLKMVIAEAIAIELHGEHKVIKTTKGDFVGRAVIIAGGSERRKLGVPGEKEYSGKGVSYCATCDAPFFQERQIAIVGGGDAAITEALHLVKFASRVMVIHRRDQLRATRILQEKALSEPKIEFLWSRVVEEIEGGDMVESLKLHNVITGEKSTIDVAGIFISVGFNPSTDYLRDVLSLDEMRHIITNENMETQIPGIYAAGDIRHNSARQAICAAGDGATAALYAEKFLSE